MKRVLPLISAIIFCSQAFAQISITQADYGQAGDSIVVGYDQPSTSISVGGTGSQTWDFTGLSLNNINTLHFEDPSNTYSGSEFPDADLAIERLTETIFFQSTSTEFVIDGVAGDGFGLGVSVIADFEPNSTQVEFPSTLNTTFVDTAQFDSIVSCVELGFGSICDSARLKRILIGTSVFDAYGDISTPGGNYTTVRQYFREDNKDTLWTKIPFIGWTLFYDSISVVHNYRWMANGEGWPVLSAIANSQNGLILDAEYKVDENVLGYVDVTQNPNCTGDCNGFATVAAVGGVPPYTYAWPSSAGSQTTATATALCAGTYIVTVTDNDTGEYEVEVTLDEPADISIAGAVQGVSVGGDGAIDANVSGGTGAFTFAWSGPDGYTASTEDINDIEIGDYTLIVTDANGCSDTMVFTVELTGLTNLGSEGLKLYPNPATESIMLTSANILSTYRMTDLLGNLVYSGTSTKNTLELDVRQLPEGVYLIEVETIKGLHLQKVTVQH